MHNSHIQISIHSTFVKQTLQHTKNEHLHAILNHTTRRHHTGFENAKTKY